MPKWSGVGGSERLLNALEEFPKFGIFLNRGDKLEVWFSGEKREISWVRLTGYSFPALT